MDSKGRPLVVYHGSPNSFNAFDRNKIGTSSEMFESEEMKSSKYGFFFTNNSVYVKGYGDNLYNVYLKLENPLFIDMSDFIATDEKIESELKKAKDNGKDGVVFKNIREVGALASDEFVVFSPNQIKSVDNRGTFDPENPNIYYQSHLSAKTRQKARDVKNALQKIVDGAEEATVKDLRDDLEQYGGTNDITFIYGDEKKGLFHIADKHGGIKTLLKVLDAVVDGNVARYSNTKKTVVVEKDGYEAVLSLDENGNKKTWLLTGWNTKISPDAEREFSATLKATQQEPTFSRQVLGAGLNNFTISQSDENVNSDGKLYQRAFSASRVDYDRPSLEAIGSGEGNQAHGWGLYYALNRDVAEGYRINFTVREHLNDLVSKYMGLYRGDILSVARYGKQHVIDFYNDLIEQNEVAIKSGNASKEY